MDFPEELQQTQNVELSWAYDEKIYVVTGSVVYKTPKGYGVRFNHSTQSKRAIEGLMAKLRKNGLFVRERLPGPEDSFWLWLKKLVRNKENLFP